ncbi:putative cysteine ligase BshC [Shouchella clausii]|uniref:bacillithiol biosynthesis cysteine-adding enzyme BshC n=1 Tax=Shouchella clausii TaxID=79880 RepID=UPI001B2C76DF|nr:bacillithiol biosynthesis cysteine-adding enzyme BshC [Shouchella clausii]GIN15962.1 putative cysteine ligase BshC [Shouchella clausii]
MRIEALDTGRLTGFLAEYVNQPDQCSDLFSYRWKTNGWEQERSEDLAKRSFSHRQALCRLLEARHAPLRKREACMDNIHKLKQENALVVVAGQQAGLMTGPLYTAYKAMSVILLAKQYEETLNQPVVPLFWIAGEDHDLDEVRYVHYLKGDTWKKLMFGDEPNGEAASTKVLPKKELDAFLAKLFASLPETSYTNTLKAIVRQAAATASTYTEFFKLLMHELFYREGLLFLDSNDPELRAIERPFFKQLIRKVDALQECQAAGEARFVEKGYPSPIATEKQNAHLFYTLDGKRRRLDYEAGRFYVREAGRQFTKDELLAEVDSHPQRFSNNVVTRPLMQEWLLPTLAFVAGPGELAYWATLKDVFALFDYKLTPIIPRLSATFVPCRVEKHLRERKEAAETYILGEGEKLKEAWLASQHSYPVAQRAQAAAEAIEAAHLPFRELAGEISPTLKKMGEKNRAFIQGQIAFLKERMEREIREQHQVGLSKYDEAMTWLHPKDAPQERILHSFILLNTAGIDIFSRLLEKKPPHTGAHLVFYV